MKNNKINVTQPSLPDIKEFIPYFESIWNSKWLTNNGPFHRKFESELAEILDVKYISLFNNGTIALMVALQALEISGEVITTPFSFVATSHAIMWNKSTPVFCDINPTSMNIDPNKIEDLITPDTTAIMPVHVYGNPCDNGEIQEIADKHNLKVIYDAAHAFNVRKNGESILNWGDLSVLSFHATKVFNTIEGGAIVCHSKEMKQKIDSLRNFGFDGSGACGLVGLNGKMNELQAAFGLLSLPEVESNINKRKVVAKIYSNAFTDIKGLEYISLKKDVCWNYSYYPILVDEDKYGISRDALYEKLRANNIYARKYFYPLISNFSIYIDFPSANKENLKIAHEIAEKVLCLPIYPDLTKEQQHQIIKIMK